MDLDDTPEQAAYRTRVRAWLDQHAAQAPPDRGDVEDDGYVGLRRAWQRSLAEAGLVGVTWPAEYGGQGLGPLEQVIVDTRQAGVATEIVDQLRNEVDEFAREPRLVDEFRVVVADSLILIHGMAKSWTDPHAVQPPATAARWARDMARRGIAANVIVRVYRLGQAVYQELWYDQLETAQGPPELLLETARAAGAFVTVWVDAITQSLLEAYENERDLQINGARAIRADALRRVLDGSLTDEHVASARLSYELARQHQALMLWTSSTYAAHERDSMMWSSRAIEALTTRRQPLVIETSAGRVLVCVSGETSGEHLARATIDAMDTTTHAALGRQQHGLGGLRASVEQARRTHRVAIALNAREEILHFNEVEGLDLLTRDIDAARAFARHTLGDLASPDPAMRRLLTNDSPLLPRRGHELRTRRAEAQPAREQRGQPNPSSERRGRRNRPRVMADTRRDRAAPATRRPDLDQHRGFPLTNMATSGEP